MTGIERLRAIAGAWDEWGLGGSLTEIADQIERELDRHDEPDSTDKGARLPYVTDEDREALEWVRKYGGIGCVQTMAAKLGDTLSWIRERAGIGEDEVVDYDELLDALDRRLMLDSCKFQKSRKVANSLTSHSDASDVSMSTYDLLPQEERDAIAWVREHGGIDHVKAEWRSRVPRDLYERKRQRLLGHIAECETALGQRRRRIEELGHHVSDLTNENSELRRRAMPEGMEWLIEAWPKFEDDAPVKLGDMALIDGDVDMVEAVQIWIHGKPVIYGDNGSQQLEKGERVKRPAVLAADGEPLDVGQTVWDVESGEELKVEKLCDVGLVQLLTRDGVSRYVYPDQLTHTKPEIDSWQRIEEDALNFVEDNAGIPHDQDQMERDMLAILRRCRALAERERGE